MEWKEKFDSYRSTLEEALPRFLPAAEGPQKRVAEAMAYSLLSGGKRIRGVLVLAMCDQCGGDLRGALPFAAAVEMVHAYSLIHDDLPCMDDDDLRRGKPSCHIAFDEATALLAGDALLTHAFDVMAESYYDGALPAEVSLRAVHALSEAAGVGGMIGGQQIDVEEEGKPMEAALLETVHSLKTGRLIRAAAKIGCIAAGASDDVILQADRYAEKIGLAFQIVDDILDATRTSEELGKSSSDLENNKTTYITLYGEEAAREKVQKLVLEADLAIKGNVLDCDFLYQFADELAKRNQ